MEAVGEEVQSQNNSETKMEEEMLLVSIVFPYFKFEHTET